MIREKDKQHIKQILTMYKTFSSIRAVDGNKWKLSYVFRNKLKLEKSVDKLISVRGTGLKETKIIPDRDLLGYYCFECFCDTRDDATDASFFLDNQLDEILAEDTYDYPIQGDDY